MDPILFLLIAANCVVFAIPYIISFGPNTAISFYNFAQLGWKSNSAIANGEYYRLLTSNFLHSDIFHLLINMYSLWAIGPSVIFVYGSNAIFLVIYLLSGIGGSFLSYLMSPSPSVGASGAIFGLVGAMLAFAIKTGNYSLLNQIVLVIIINVAIGFTPGTRIDNYGHLGGLITGFVVGFLFLIFFPQMVGMRAVS